jgi:anti-anti-sigma factor
MMLTRIPDSAAADEEPIMAARADDDRPVPATLELSHRISPAGETVVAIGGELDIATAEHAVRYVRQVTDRHRGPVIVDLAALSFCDAGGMGALLRMADHAEQAGCPFRLASPRPPLVKIMRITGLDRRFLPSPGACPPDSQGHTLVMSAYRTGQRPRAGHGPGQPSGETARSSRPG